MMTRRGSRGDRTRHEPLPGRAVLMLAALAVALAACGGTSAATTSTSRHAVAGSRPARASSATSPRAGSKPTAGGHSSTPAPGFAAFRACLKAHGVSPPGRPGGLGAQRPPTTGTRRPSFGAAFRKAAASCAKLRPKGGFGLSSAQRAAFAAYRNCLELKGARLAGTRGGAAPGAPASAPGTTGASRTRGPGPSPFEHPSPKLKAALAACAPLRPSFPGRPGPGGAPSTTAASSAASGSAG